MLLHQRRKQQQKAIIKWFKDNTTPELLAQTSDTDIYRDCRKDLKLDISKTLFTRLIAPYGFKPVSKRLDNTSPQKVYVFKDLDIKQCDHCNGTGLIHNR